MDKLVFGPVPSRRLGMSLGVNTIPYKQCTYSCVYCQLGVTLNKRVQRTGFYNPEALLEQVRDKLGELAADGERIDWLTVLADGEPTLDNRLRELVEGLKSLKIPVAVWTNGSLLAQQGVQQDLMRADLVSVKIDAASKEVWQKINRPHIALDHVDILLGILDFSKSFRGVLISETMLIDSGNDNEGELSNIAALVSKMQPSRCYLTLPHRPPAECGVDLPPVLIQNKAMEIFQKASLSVELLNVPEDSTFPAGRWFEEDLLSLLSVHPVREETLLQMTKRSGRSWNEIESMVEKGQLHKKVYNQTTFYSRY